MIAYVHEDRSAEHRVMSIAVAGTTLPDVVAGGTQMLDSFTLDGAGRFAARIDAGLAVMGWELVALWGAGDGGGFIPASVRPGCAW